MFPGWFSSHHAQFTTRGFPKMVGKPNKPMGCFLLKMDHDLGNPPFFGNTLIYYTIVKAPTTFLWVETTNQKSWGGLRVHKGGDQPQTFGSGELSDGHLLNSDGYGILYSEFCFSKTACPTLQKVHIIYGSYTKRYKVSKFGSIFMDTYETPIGKWQPGSQN